MNNPNRAFYVREITRKIDEQINSVRRELGNLLSIGVITSESSNNRLYYEVDQKYDNYGSLKSMFGEGHAKDSKVVEDAEEDGMASQIKRLGSVDLAVLSGSFTRDDLSPVDVMVIGDINRTKMINFIKDLEATEGREIRYTSMATHEYEYRMDVNDRFLSNVLSAKKTVVIDKNNLLQKK